MSYLPSRKFTTSTGRTYEVVRTEGNENESALKAIDTVVNQEGEKKRMNRTKTIKLYKS